MDQSQGSATERNPTVQPYKGIDERLSDLESAVAQLRRHGPATDGGDGGLDRGTVAKLRHVLEKYFPHDNPPIEPAEPGSLGYSPFDDTPVTQQFSDGTDGNEAGMRWPRQQTRKSVPASLSRNTL